MVPPATPGHRGVRRAHGLLCAAVVLPVLACAQATHEASWPDLVTARQQDAIAGKGSASCIHASSATSDI